jgi:hypothetical protein
MSRNFCSSIDVVYISSFCRIKFLCDDDMSFYVMMPFFLYIVFAMLQIIFVGLY